MTRLIVLPFITVMLLSSIVFAEVVGVSPGETYADLFYDNTYLVDVRIPAEYYWVGHPGVNNADDPGSTFLSGKIINIPYKLWELDKKTNKYIMIINPTFTNEIVTRFPEEATLYFMCRSGVRAIQAQEHLLNPENSTSQEFVKIQTYTMFNVEEGFEGEPDEVTGHRNVSGFGWKNSGLPYIDGSEGIWTPPIKPLVAHLESPLQNSFESGIGLIRGWVCDAATIEIKIDDQIPYQVAYGTTRSDTKEVCGDTNNGFGFTFNWNSLGTGSHNLRAIADGHEFANVTFTVTTLGEEFLQNISGEYDLTNFPTDGERTTIRWAEPHQNFVIVGH